MKTTSMSVGETVVVSISSFMAFQSNSFFSQVESSPGILHTADTRLSGVEDSLVHIREALENVVQENKALWIEITALKIHIEELPVVDSAAHIIQALAGVFRTALNEKILNFPS